MSNNSSQNRTAKGPFQHYRFKSINLYRTTRENTIEPNTSSIYVWFQKDIMAWYTPSQMLHLFAHLCPSINRVAKFSREGDFGMSNNSSENRTVKESVSASCIEVGFKFNLFWSIIDKLYYANQPMFLFILRLSFFQTNLQALLSCTAMNQKFLF